MINIVRSIVDAIYRDRRLLAAIIVINIAGSLFGAYYYWEQLMMTPVYLWIFVPDCPLYTLFMIFALLLIIMGKPSDTFNAITSVGLSMYGTWTVLVLLYFSEIYFRPANSLLSSAMLISHIGMALECVLLLPYLKNVKTVSWVVAGAWFLVQTIVDYFLWFIRDGDLMRTHPLAIMEYYTRGHYVIDKLAVKLDTMMYVTFAMVVVFLALNYILAKTWPANDPRLLKTEAIAVKNESGN
ncbi:DUF1405 domain-containing protein [Methanocella sp. CWC-04]|uniref:DUF1405 domain-containing protein n=1 Tax=Methanooceanicella nereidis TaxID=2052831 RepID=A0AAP2R9Y4_9EURY|nr:DUF1405 domain-containing protein [Methanocella sp. CWC-04]MCD1293628.1 DUF1405 domain-containing protein [Methanocella sp. CWC-04]